MTRQPSRRPWPDVIGVALLALAAAGLVVSDVAGPGTSTTTLAALGLAVGSYVVGRSVSRLGPWVGGAVTLSVLVVAVMTPGAFSGGPTAGPLGYGNANGALYVQAAGAAGCLVVAPALVRLGGVLATVLLVGAAIVAGSVTAVATGALVVLAAAVAAVGVAGHVVRWASAAMGALLFTGASALTVVLAVVHDGSGLPNWLAPVVRGLSERRLDLWSDAVDIADQHPLGVGDLEFAMVSPTAAADPDTRAAHSALLELGAEHGWLVAILVAAVALWVLLRLAVSPTPLALVGIAAWTALLLHTTVDYVADFPAVLAIAALVAGVATSSVSPQRASRAPDRADPPLRRGAGIQG